MDDIPITHFPRPDCADILLSGKQKADARFPESSPPQSDLQASAPTGPSTSPHLPCVITLSVRRRAPPSTASPSWSPGPGLRSREQPPRGALWYDGMKAVRARRASIYLRLLPQRRRRHRTLGVAGLGEAGRPGSGGPQAVSPRFRAVSLQQRQQPLWDLPVPVTRVLTALSYRTEPAELKCPP